MKSASATTSAAPGRILLQEAGAGRTGALVVDAAPGGSLYLVDGLVTYAESPAAPGVGELLTASGRLAARTWQAAADAGAPRSRVGRLLVEQGHLTQGELELCVLGAIYDAAYFVLRPTSAPVTFVPDARHWLGTVVRVDAAAVAREARRRGRLLDDIFPDPGVDTAPVTPVPWPPVDRVQLTAGQWELLVHADGQRTAADLAQLLGRAGYATVQELRRLAGLGLVEVPGRARHPDRLPGLIRLPAGRGPAVAVDRPTAPAATPQPVTAGDARTAPERPPGAQRAIPDQPGPERGTERAGTERAGTERAGTERGGTERLPRLPRRKPNARLPKGLAAVDSPAAPSSADEVLLTRIRSALKALR